MKHITLIVVAVCALLSCNNQNDYVTLAGKVDNANSGKIYVRDLESNLIDSLLLDSIHTFAGRIVADEGYYQLFDGKEQTPVYLKPGYDLVIDLDAAKFDESIKYTGAGADENNYLAQCFLKYENNDYLGKALAYEEPAFVALMDSMRNDKVKYLNSHSNLSDCFKSFEQQKYKYERLLNLNMYQQFHGYVTRQPKFVVSNDFPDIMAEVNWQNPADLKNPYFIEVAYGCVQKMAISRMMKQKYGMQTALLHIIDSIEAHPEIKSRLAYNSRMYFLDSKDLDSAFSLYNKLLIGETYIAEIANSYYTIKKLEKGNPSATFALPDVNGDTVKLSDLRGKHVYIDIWASWCAPCVMEIPHLKKLIETFKGEDIIFVSICVWDEKDNWIKALETHNLEGIQLFAERRDEPFIKAYLISGVPRFILIDENGNILDPKAPPPSSPRTKELFLNQVNGLLPKG